MTREKVHALTVADRAPQPGDILTDPNTGKKQWVYAVYGWYAVIADVPFCGKVRGVHLGVLRGESVIESEDGRYILGMESDGNAFEGCKRTPVGPPWEYVERADGGPVFLGSPTL